MSATEEQIDVTKPAPAKKKSAPRSKATSRQPGRPYKRLAKDVLQTRSSALTKKLQVLQAKRTLLADRLEAYENETKLREQEAKDEA